jgi:multiple antibiotic resistance protein
MGLWWTDIVLPAFATLFVIIDPLGLTPLFLALTSSQSVAERRRVALLSVGLAAGVLFLFAFFGHAILNLFGISLPAFRIAGGLLLFVIALEMLFEKRAQRRERNLTDRQEEPAAGDDIWVFPLGIPLIAGPGAITSIILLMDRHAGDVAAQALVMAVLAAVLAMTLIMFWLMSTAERFLSQTAIRAITRLLGIILAALAVQFVLTGLKSAGLAG